MKMLYKDLQPTVAGKVLGVRFVAAQQPQRGADVFTQSV
jgi:hypothetical protein